MPKDYKSIIYPFLFILTIVIYFVLIIQPIIYFLGVNVSFFLICLYFVFFSFVAGFLSKFFLLKYYASEKTYLIASLIVSTILAFIGIMGGILTEILNLLRYQFERIEAAGGTDLTTGVFTIGVNPHILFLLSFFSFNIPYFLIFFNERRKLLFYLIPISIYFMVSFTIYFLTMND